MFLRSMLAVIGWGFLISSWVIPYLMRKQSDTFEDRMKSYNVGMVLSAIALAISDLVLFGSIT